jgi:sn-glycerol 3-phosphate transport system permease protein
MINRNKAFAHIVLACVSLVVLTPFLLTLSMAFKSLPEVMTLNFRWFPNELRFTNFKNALAVAPWGRYYINTVLLVLMVLSIQIVTISLASYAFGRMKFRGKNLLFFLFLIQMMIPAQSLIVPNYMTLSSLKLLDTILAIGVVYFASAYGIYLMRQAIRAIPMALEDSASMEGCSTLRFIFQILIPLSKPSLIAFSLVSLTHHWNEFFWPIIVTDTARARPLTVGLAMLTQATESSPEWTLTAAATLIIIAPLFLSFLIFQRKFIDSFISSGIKG